VDERPVQSAALFAYVRYWRQPGKHLLILSFTGLTLTGLQVRFRTIQLPPKDVAVQRHAILTLP
jgi:hypothetical protein